MRCTLKPWLLKGRYNEALQLEYEQNLENDLLMLGQKQISEEQFLQPRNELNKVYSAKMMQGYSELQSAVESPINSGLDEMFRRGTINAKKFFAEMLKGISKPIMQAYMLKAL